MTEVLRIDCTTGEAELVALTPEEEAALEAGQADADATYKARQWEVIESVRGLQLTQTDWTVEPFTNDLPDDVAEVLHAHEAEWLAFREALRDLPADGGDPTAVVWPALPAAPVVTIIPPPIFVQLAAPWPGRYLLEV